MKVSGWVRAGLLLLTVAVIAAGLIPIRPVVELSAEGEPLGSFSATRPFTLSYIHSIDGLPIEEDLEVSNGEFLVKRTRLKQFGAGMGYIPGAGVGRAEGEWWVVDELDRNIGNRLIIRAGAAHIDHRVSTETTQWLLSACWPGQRIQVETSRASLFKLAWNALQAPKTSQTTECILEETS